MSDREAGPIPRGVLKATADTKHGVVNLSAMVHVDNVVIRDTAMGDISMEQPGYEEYIFNTAQLAAYALALQEVVGDLTADCSDGMEDPECFFCGADYAGNVMDYDYKHLKGCAFARGKALLPEEENDE